MRRRTLLLFLLAAALPAFARAATEPTTAQPTLPVEKLVIVGHDGRQHVFHVEMALTEPQQVTGLMFRKSVPADGGMLFDWGAPRESQMWMENTLVPLDMVFIKPDGTISHIAENTVPESEAIIDGGVARATLELQGGITQKLDIRVGDKVEQRIFGNAP